MANWRTALWRPARSLGTTAVCALVLLAPTRAMAEGAAATHVVQPGETLSDIAASVGLDSTALAALNGLDDVNLLSVGQSLKLPVKSSAATPAPAPATPPTPVPTYTVAAGDTLWGVAQQLTTTTAALADANHLDDPDHLVAGTLLVVPDGAPVRAATAPAAAPTVSPKPAAAPQKRSLLVPYTVQAGETLNQIARQFETSADAIVQASGLDDANRLSVGSVLKVPVPGREHVVQPGETLRDIAAQEKVDLGSLIDFNAFEDPQLIRIGQVVLVPAASTGQTAASSEPAPQPPAPAPPAPAAAKPAVSAAPAGAKPAVSADASKPAAPAAVVVPPAGAAAGGLAAAGLKLLGAPYVWGGSNPSGFDCSGFVWYVARQAGKQLSRGMLGEYSAGPHPGRDELKPGDVVFFQNTYTAGLSHNGIYIGNGRFVHAADEAAGVTVSSLGAPYWANHWFGATRLS